jgi:hypothetical protein
MAEITPEKKGGRQVVLEPESQAATDSVNAESNSLRWSMVFNVIVLARSLPRSLAESAVRFFIRLGRLHTKSQLNNDIVEKVNLQKNYKK